MRPLPALLVLGSCALGCDRRATPAPDLAASGVPATASAPAQAASAPAASASASASASVPAAPAPTSVTATRLLAGPPGGLVAALTLLRTEPGGGAVLLNETTGEFLVGTAQDEGERVALQVAGLALTIEPPAASKAGALRWSTGASVALRRAPVAVPATAPVARRFVGADGASFEVTPEQQAQRAWYEAAPRPGDASARGVRPVALVHQGRWLPAAPGAPEPKTVVLGGQKIRPEALAPGSTFGCVVHGWAPALEGPQAAVVQEAWQSWVRDRCVAGPGVVVELSYSLAPLAGMNVPDVIPARNAFDQGMFTSFHRSPTSSTVMPINLTARVTTETASARVEEALLLDTQAGTCPRLGALVSPKGGAATIENWALDTLQSMAGWVPSDQRRAAVALDGPRLTVGPSSVDVVIPPRPFGIALPSRHVVIGPRSTLVGAFTPSAATQRLTAALNVDY